MGLFVSSSKVEVLTVPPIGGEIRPATIIPSRVVQCLAKRETIIVLLIATAISLSFLNIMMVLLAGSRAKSIPYVADGSPFGCQVEVPGR